MSEQELPRGVTGSHVLPAGHHDGPWDSIVVPGGDQGTAARDGARGNDARAPPGRAPGAAKRADRARRAAGHRQDHAGAGARPGGGPRRRGARSDDVPRDRPARPAERDARGKPAERDQAAARRRSRAGRRAAARRRADRRGGELRGATRPRVVRDEPGRRAAGHRRGARRPRPPGGGGTRSRRRDHDELPGRGGRGVPLACRPGRGAWPARRRGAGADTGGGPR